MTNYHLRYNDGKYSFLPFAFRASIIFVIIITNTGFNGFGQQHSEETQESESLELVTPSNDENINSTADEDVKKEATLIYLIPVSVLKEQQRASSKAGKATKEELNTKLEETEPNSTVITPK